MKIIPYQVLMKPEEITDSDSTTGIPQLNTLKSKKAETDGSYVFHTHDRCDSDEPNLRGYYQIVFRLEDASPFPKNELSLSLNGSIYQNSGFPVSNDLYYDQEADLWYQQTRYKRNTDGGWSIIAQNRKGHLAVDSITTAGVFKLTVFRNGVPLTSAEYDQPWIYVLPGVISKKDYLQMLADLLNLNEKLVRKDYAGVSAGTVSAVEAETARLEQVIQAMDELYDAVRGVMALPSELLGKKYRKTSIQKVHHFDSKTVRDYIRYGMSGITTDAVYYEDHDTYENRVIKYVLQMIRLQTEAEQWKSDAYTIRSEEEMIREAQERGDARAELLRKNRILVSPTEQSAMKETLFQSFLAENQTRKLANERRQKLLEKKQELCGLLSDKWFAHIKDMGSLSEIRMTPKFQSNRFYSRVYQIITQQYMDKPFLSAALDVNAFGVNATQQVYEYWVFSKIVEHLMDLGFVMDSGESHDDIKDCFSNFSHNKGLMPVVIPLTRSDEKRKLHIDVGYNCSFSSSAVPGLNSELKKTPDYYIRVYQDDEKLTSHWYFMDAKYKPFSHEKKRGKVYFADEIQSVSVAKYIDDMGVIFDTNPEYGSDSEDIRGSFIIMASIDDESPLSANNRLLGGAYGDDYYQHIVKEETKRIEMAPWRRLNIPYRYSGHKCGAILLTPEHQEELSVLIEMIFEYLETICADGLTDGLLSGKNHPNLGWCWKCNSLEVERSESETGGGLAKYYTTCKAKNCSDFRVITNCSGWYGKHLLVKHAEDNYHLIQSGQPWAFECPICGDRIRRY